MSIHVPYGVYFSLLVIHIYNYNMCQQCACTALQQTLANCTILGLQSSATQTQNVFETFQFSNFN